MQIRAATADDRSGLRDLYRAYSDEAPPPAAELELELQDVDEFLEQGIALFAEVEPGTPAGFLLARMSGARQGWIHHLYVAPARRRSGVAAALVRTAVEELRDLGAEVIELEVRPSNQEARVVCERWGFYETSLRLSVAAEALAEWLSREAAEPSVGLVFVQSDDESRVGQAVRAFVPRLGRSARTDVRSPENGWIAVDDELCSGDPASLRRLAQELSYRTGGVVLSLGIEEGVVVRYVLFDRGSVADEYASLPEYGGPLPPGDVVGLSANPTVAHRLTGADPDRVRAVARTASSPSELQAPPQLMAELADVLGVPHP